MSRTTIALLALLAVTGPSFAQTKPTTQPIDTAAVAKLVEQLGADDAATREAAKQSLATMGTAVSPELEKAVAATSDPEVRTSLQTLIVDIAKNDRSKPTLVTLRLKGVPAKAAVEALAEQTGVTIGTWPDWVWRNNKKTVTIDVEKRPFWEVLTDICAQAGLMPESNGSQGARQITLQENSSAGKPFATWYGDGFLVIPRSASRNHSIDYNQPKQRNESFSIGMRIYADPKLRVLRGSRQIIATEAVDENGKSLLPDKKNSSEEYLDSPSFGCSWLWDAQASLRYLPEQGKMLKSLKAKAAFMVVDQEETWEIDLANLAKDSRTFNGVTYTIDSFTAQGGNYSLKYTVTFKEAMFNRRPRQENPLTDWSSIQQMIKLTDAKGAAFYSQGGGGGGGGGKLTFEQNFRKPDEPKGVGEPTKLTWTVPVSIKRVELPIEFKDLPIP